MQQVHSEKHAAGWLVFAISAIGLLLWLLRTKFSELVTHTITFNGLDITNPEIVYAAELPTWDSNKDAKPPSYVSAPPFQESNGNLSCAPGWTLMLDKSSGKKWCFKL